MKVLVVDSDLHTLHALVVALREGGYEPLAASSYEEGKRLWIAEHPPLLVADVRLGQFNGLQLLLRARADRPDLTAIITSPFPDRSLEEDTRRFGGIFLVKPVKPEEVLAIVRDRGREFALSTSERPFGERRQEDRRRKPDPTFSPDRRLFDRRSTSLPNRATGAELRH